MLRAVPIPPEIVGIRISDMKRLYFPQSFITSREWVFVDNAGNYIDISSIGTASASSQASATFAPSKAISGTIDVTSGTDGWQTSSGGIPASFTIEFSEPITPAKFWWGALVNDTGGPRCAGFFDVEVKYAQTPGTWNLVSEYTGLNVGLFEQTGLLPEGPTITGGTRDGAAGALFDIYQ